MVNTGDCRIGILCNLSRSYREINIDVFQPNIFRLKTSQKEAQKASRYCHDPHKPSQNLHMVHNQGTLCNLLQSDISPKYQTSHNKEGARFLQSINNIHIVGLGLYWFNQSLILPLCWLQIPALYILHKGLKYRQDIRNKKVTIVMGIEDNDGFIHKLNFISFWRVQYFRCGYLDTVPKFVWYWNFCGRYINISTLEKR